MPFLFSKTQTMISTYSHTAPDLNLHVVASQQLLSCPPGSQSSPASLMPLPHIFKDVVFLVPGARKEIILSTRDD